MTIQMSTTLRNARLDQIESTIGVSAKLLMYSGAVPANCAASATGTLMVTYSLASDWMAAASAGAKAFNNLPLTVTAAAGGILGYFRLTASDGVTCHLQGTITATGLGGDMTVDNTNVTLGQSVNVTGFTLNEPGA